jgi:mono/diheme cytochrome c family protein
MCSARNEAMLMPVKGRCLAPCCNPAEEARHMHHFSRYFMIAALLSTSIFPLAAQTRGDPNRGYRFAERVCAQCHAIERNELGSPLDDAPTFSAIAQSSGMTGLALSVFLRTPHSTMPNLVLSMDQITDVAAYIESLKP